MRQRAGMMAVHLGVQPPQLVGQVVAAEAPPVEIRRIVGPSRRARLLRRLRVLEAPQPLVPGLVQLLDRPVLLLEPACVCGKQIRVAGVGDARLVLQQPHAVGGMIAVPRDDLLEVDLRVLAQLGIRKVAPGVIERRRPHPAGRVFRTERVRDQDAVLRGGIVDPVVAAEVPLPLLALDLVPQREDAGDGQSRVGHAAKVLVDGVARLRPVEEELGADPHPRQARTRHRSSRGGPGPEQRSRGCGRDEVTAGSSSHADRHHIRPASLRALV